MRTHTVMLLLLFLFSVGHSQNVSTRLSGMGNISIAVPDTESEVFSNPAKASWLGGTLLRLNPYYTKTSNEYKTSTASPNYPTYDIESMSDSRYGIPVGIVIPASSFRFGLSASLESMNTSNSSGYAYGGSYSYSSQRNNETESTYRYVTLLAAFDLGWGSVGATSSWSSSPAENHTTGYSVSSGQVSSDETRDKDDRSGHTYGLGMLFGSRDVAEVSFTATTDGYNEETEVTFNTYNNVPQDLSTSAANLASGRRTEFIAEIRRSVTENLTAGIRFHFNRVGLDISQRDKWYDYGATAPFYGERKLEHDDQDEYGVGVGLSYSLEERALIGAEYVRSIAKTTGEAYFTADGLYPTGAIYRHGDLMETMTQDMVRSEIRIGAELHITPGFTARVGVETVLTGFDTNSDSHYNLATTKSSGRTSNAFFGSGGISYTAGAIRIDYGLGMVPSNDWYYMADAIFHHSVTLSYRL